MLPGWPLTEAHCALRQPCGLQGALTPVPSELPWASIFWCVEWDWVIINWCLLRADFTLAQCTHHLVSGHGAGLGGWAWAEVQFCVSSKLPDQACAGAGLSALPVTLTHFRPAAAGVSYPPTSFLWRPCAALLNPVPVLWGARRLGRRGSSGLSPTVRIPISSPTPSVVGSPAGDLVHQQVLPPVPSVVGYGLHQNGGLLCLGCCLAPSSHSGPRGGQGGPRSWTQQVGFPGWAGAWSAEQGWALVPLEGSASCPGWQFWLQGCGRVPSLLFSYKSVWGLRKGHPHTGPEYRYRTVRVRPSGSPSQRQPQTRRTGSSSWLEALEPHSTRLWQTQALEVPGECELGRVGSGQHWAQGGEVSPGWAQSGRGPGAKMGRAGPSRQRQEMLVDDGLLEPPRETVPGPGFSR